MKRILLSAAVAAIIAGPAIAADMPTKAPLYKALPPVCIWCGFYVGVNAGGHWASDRMTYFADPVGWGAAGAAELDARAATSLKPKGGIFGVQAGYNWAWPNSAAVFGFEADVNGLTGSTSRSTTFPGAVNFNGGDIATDSSKDTFLATFRARLGLTFGNALLYATGGLAVATIKTADSWCSFACVAPAVDLAAVSSSTTRTGGTFGGGVEWKAWNNWSWKAEYLYVSLGSFTNLIPSCAACAAGSDIAVTHRFRDNIFRVGLNYHWGSPVVASY